MMVRNVLVQFISDHKDHFSALVMDPEGTETIESHITKMRKPMFWASQVEIQAAADFYAAPIYIYTPTPRQDWVSLVAMHTKNAVCTIHKLHTLRTGPPS